MPPRDALSTGVCPPTVHRQDHLTRPLSPSHRFWRDPRQGRNLTQGTAVQFRQGAAQHFTTNVAASTRDEISERNDIYF